MSRIIYSARVVSTEDPESLGRIQVTLDGFEESLELPWIRMVTGLASDGFGVVVLPEVDDEVIVLQGDAEDLDHMICLGSVYNGNRKPHYSNEDGDNNQKTFKTRAGHIVTFSDEDGAEKISLETPDEKLSICLDHADGRITVTASDEVHIDVSGGKVIVDCDTAEVNADGDATVKAGGDVTLKADGSVEVNGAQKVTVESASEVTVKAAQVSIDSSSVDIG